MRKTIVAALALLILLMAWIAWPLLALHDIARSAQSGDVMRIEQRIDYESLSRSLSGQLLQTYAELTGAPINRGLLAGIASAVADPIFTRFVSRIALTQLVQNGWPAERLGAPPPNFEGLKWDRLGDVGSLFMNASYGFGTFRLWVPLDQPQTRQFRLHLALSGFTWKVTGLELPRELRERLVREILKQQGKLG